MTQPPLSSLSLFFTLSLFHSLSLQEMLTSREGRHNPRETSPCLGECAVEFVRAGAISELALGGAAKRYCHAAPAIVAAASETSFCTVPHCSLICRARH